MLSVGSATSQTLAAEITSPLESTTVTSSVVGGVSLQETNKNPKTSIDRNAILAVCISFFFSYICMNTKIFVVKQQEAAKGYNRTV
jgi:hypothetical protein